MKDNELRKILEEHQKWLNTEIGKMADLRGANLWGANLHEANLRRADFRGADLRKAELCRANLREAKFNGADLRGADFREANLRVADLDMADLREADLYGANLGNANFYGADLSGTVLREANLFVASLRGADLTGADLREANLWGANLFEADLYGADLRGANLNMANLQGAKNVPYIPLACPDTGAFIAWKKASGYVIKLLIPEDAKRSSATSRKCRANKAIVLSIEKVDGTPSELSEAASNYDPDFLYRIGETVEVKDFCEDRFNECAPGIHFFVNREEAVNY